MNEKIPLHRFASGVAGSTGLTSRQAEEFIKTLFTVVAEELRQGQSVTVPGIGTFAIGSQPAEPVIFTPLPDFAAKVNSPFAIFSPVALAPQVTDEMLEAVPAEQPVAEEIPTPAEPTVVSEKPEEAAQPQPTVEIPRSLYESADDEEEEPVEEPEREDMEEKRAQEPEEDSAPGFATGEPVPTKFWSGFIGGLIVGIAIGLLALCAYVFYYIDTPVSADDVETELIEADPDPLI